MSRGAYIENTTATIKVSDFKKAKELLIKDDSSLLSYLTYNGLADVLKLNGYVTKQTETELNITGFRGQQACMQIMYVLKDLITGNIKWAVEGEDEYVEETYGDKDKSKNYCYFTQFIIK